MTAMTWIRSHTLTLVVAGALIVGGGGVVAAATLPQALEPQADPTSEAVTAPNAKPVTATSDEADEQPGTTPGTNGGTDPVDPANPNTPGTPPANNPAPPAPVVEEPAPEPPAPATPGAVTGVSVSSDGAGGFTVSWGTPDMHGATLAYYWVDIVDPGYTTGDRITPIYGNSISGNATPGTNCAVIAAVSTDGIQGDVSGPYCW